MLSKLWLYVMNNSSAFTFLDVKNKPEPKSKFSEKNLENSQREKNERILESLLPSPPLLLSSSLDFLKKRKMGENKESENRKEN